MILFVKSINLLSEMEQTLEKCEKCCHKKEKNKIKNNTYSFVRHKYVHMYWDALNMVN